MLIAGFLLVIAGCGEGGNWYLIFAGIALALEA